MNIIVTGGNSGIGLELTKMLLKEGHQLGLILRNEKRKAETEAILGTSDQIDYFFADLSNQEQIKQAVKEIEGKWDHVDGLFNNAGVLLDKVYESPQGNEMHYEVNTLTPYLLATSLKPLLENAEAPFVINTTTGSMHRQKKMDVAELKSPTKFVKLLGSYMNSKLAMTTLMNDLAGEWPGIRIASVDPGPNKSKMTAGAGMPGWLLPLRNLFFPPASKGAGLLHKAAFEDQFQAKSGVYISSNKVKPMSMEISDADKSSLLAGIK